MGKISISQNLNIQENLSNQKVFLALKASLNVALSSDKEGRGFIVSASAIKKLADQTAKSV